MRTIWGFIGLIACAPEARTGLVLVEGVAHERGVALHVDGQRTTSVLPVAIDGRIRVEDPDGAKVDVDVDVGEIVFIGFDHALVVDRQRLATVDLDEVAVDGAVDALEALAEDVDADVALDGETAWFTGRDALLQLADADDVDGLRAVWTMRDADAARIVEVRPSEGCGLAPETRVIGGDDAGWAWVDALREVFVGDDADDEPEVIAIDADLVPFVGYYDVGDEELALSIDGYVREVGDEAPVGTWTLDARGQPIVEHDARQWRAIRRTR